MKAERCQASTRSGKPCNAQVVADGMCAWHAPSWAERRRQWSAEGGRKRSNEARARKQLDGDVRDMTDVKGRLMVALAKVEGGDIDPGVANAMANLARAIATVVGVADFEAQLAELRHELTALSGHRGA